MKRLILSADIKNNTDESYIKYCCTTVEAYAKIFNYDYKFNQIGKTPDNRHSSWARIPLLYKYLNEYDEILWIDSSIIIWNQKVDVFECLKTAHESTWKRDPSIKPIGYTTIGSNGNHACSSILLIDCSDKARVKQFLNDWWNDSNDDKYNTNPPYEQYVWNNIWAKDINKSSYLRVTNMSTNVFNAEEQLFINIIPDLESVRLPEAKKYFMNLLKPHKYRVGIFVRQQNYYSNGIGQNCIFMKQAIESTGRMVDLIVTNFDNKNQFVSKDIGYAYTDEASINLNNYDIFICGSFIPPIEKLKKYKETGIKLISFNPINVFDQFHHEAFLYKDKEAPLTEQAYIDWADEIWVTEHHAKYSSEYLETLNLMKVPVKSVPHVWNDLFISNSLSQYQKRNTNVCDIIILEPNISYSKSAWYSLMIAERLYLTKPQLLGTVYLFNTPETNLVAMKMINSLQITKNKKIRFFKRLQSNEIYSFFSQSKKSNDHNVIMLSHTINVPMNYTYYEALKLGFPLVHNSQTLKDLKLGYYYEGLSDACTKIENISTIYEPEKERLSASDFLNTLEPYNTSISFDNLLKFEKKELKYSDIENPLVISYDNKPTKTTEMFISTCKNNDWVYKMIGLGETWKGFISKMHGYRNFLRTVNPKKIVVVSDARDVVCVRTSKSFVQGFVSFKKSIVVSMELLCQGRFEVNETEKMYKCAPLKKYWQHHKIEKIPDRKFANSGLIAGYAGELLHMWDWIINNNFNDDQLGVCYYINAFPEKIAVDTDAKLLHTSVFGVNAGIQNIQMQGNDSISLAELFGRRAYFLHIPGINNHGQKIIYETVVNIIQSGVNSKKLLTPYGYNEPQFDKPTLDKPTLDKPNLDKPNLDKPKFQFLTVSVSEERRKQIRYQCAHVAKDIPLYFIEPDNLSSYFPVTATSIQRKTMDCARNHYRALERASQSGSPDFSVILEDDVAFHKTDFITTINEIIERWSEIMGDDKMASIGWVPCRNYSEYLKLNGACNIKCLPESKILANMFVVGMQAYIVRKKDLVQYIDILIKPTYKEYEESIKSQEYKYIEPGRDVIACDIVIPRILGQRTLFPPAAIEAQNVQSIIGHKQEFYWNKFFKGYEHLLDNYFAYPSYNSCLTNVQPTLNIYETLDICPVVIFISEERKKHMETQIKVFGSIKTHFYKGSKPEDCKSYITYKYPALPESDTTLCCTKSHIGALKHFLDNSDKQVVLIMEDDTILRKDFMNKLMEILNSWKSHEDIDYISIGHLPGEVKSNKSEGELHWGLDCENGNVWGTQAYLMKRNIAEDVVKHLDQENTLKIYESIKMKINNNNGIYYSRKAIRLNIDAILSICWRQAFIRNMIVVESPLFNSLITPSHSNSNTRRWNEYFKSGKLKVDDFAPECELYLKEQGEAKKSKYQITVITCSSVRKKQMEHQFKTLKIDAPITFLDGWTPVSCHDYLPNDVPLETKRHICCTRSHISALEIASKSEFDFSIIMEDDAAIHKIKFATAVNEIIEKWDTLVSPDVMASIGWVPGQSYKSYLEKPSIGSLDSLLGSRVFNSFFAWGTRAYIVRKKDILKFIPLFKKTTFKEFYETIHAENFKYIKKEDALTNVDTVINRIMGQRIFFPPLVIESRSPSTIADKEHALWDNFFNGVDVIRNDYFGVGAPPTLKIENIESNAPLASNLQK